MDCKIIIICALTDDFVIGKDNKIPWHIKEDFKLFKSFTENNIVIMGRNTFNSIPQNFRPLPKRINIVISQNLDFEKEKNHKDFFVFNDLKKAIEFCKKKIQKEIFLIGGNKIYKEGLSYCDKLYLSFVKKKYEGNVFFPKVDLKKLNLIEEKDFEEFIFRKFEK